MQQEEVRPAVASNGTNLPDRLAGTTFDTSEKELLISAATLFSLFQLMNPVLDKFKMITIREPDSIVMLLFTTYALFAIATMICAFSVHLAARGFWIGMLGLRSVYPEKTDMDKQPSGPLVKEFLKKKLPDIDSLVIMADRLSSIIFSFGTAIAIVNAYYAIMVGFLGLIALLLKAWIPFEISFFGMLGFLLFCQTTFGLIDLYYKKFPDRLNREGLLARGWNAGFTVLFYLSGQPFYGPIFAAFTANIAYKKVLMISFLFLGGAIALILGNTFMIGSKDDPIGHDLFSVRGPHAVPVYFYENLRPDGLDKKLTAPFLDTDIVVKPYVKLFLPMKAGSFRRLEDECSDLGSLEELSGDERKEASAKIIACANTYFKLTLDETELVPDLLFHQHQKTRMPGFLMYIPVRDLPNGKHVLTVVRGFGDDTIRFTIPFWK